jgi:hypothetical protein
MKIKNIFFYSLFFLCGIVSAQNFYDINTIQKIEITFSQSNWDFQLDTSKAGADGYIMAQSVLINGVFFDSVGVKYKGNSSYNPSNQKNPFHIELDTYKNQSYLGVKDIKLGNNHADPSMIREVLAYDILKNYMHCPQANFAKVYINGVYYGVYSNAESIGKQFYSNHFYSSGNTAIKCNPIVNPSPNAKSNLKYITTGDSSNYFNFYEIKSNYGWNNLRALADTVTNFQTLAERNIDIDRVIWMLAFNMVVVNLDSYTGAFCQNYYLYKDNTKHYNPIIWDLNMSFGGFPYIGSSNSSLAQQSITGLQQLPMNAHATDPYWPLINLIHSNAQYKRMYHAHIRTIINEFFANSTYTTAAQQYQALIDTSVQSDNFKQYSYTSFQNGLTANTSVGSYSVPGISNLMTARVSYLQNTTDFLYVAPTISNISVSTPSPVLGTTVVVSANVVNTGTVYIGYRDDITKKFIKEIMYDDGLHNDGAAGDNVYAATLNITSTQMHYYIYAENTNAGIFSPQRAEHEYYLIQTNIAQPNSGEVVINEFLASNQSGVLDDAGENEDWIELYNTTNSSLDLSGLFLSDSYTNPQKFIFPNNTIIPAQGFLTLWADENNATTTALHCNFKLSAGGERLILSKSSFVLDSISFGPQLADISIGRCPDGTGTFTIQNTPTYNTNNCAVGINELELSASDIYLFPNPANTIIMLHCSRETEYAFSITNILGEKVLKGSINKNAEINISALNNGVYFITVLNQTIKFMVIH